VIMGYGYGIRFCYDMIYAGMVWSGLVWSGVRVRVCKVHFMSGNGIGKSLID